MDLLRLLFWRKKPIKKSVWRKPGEYPFSQECWRKHLKTKVLSRRLGRSIQALRDSMGSTPTVSSGTRFAVSTALPATYDAAGFSALTYTQIRGVRSVADIGKQYQTQASNTIGQVRPVNRRTGLASASLPLELVRIADAGQSILRAAIDASTSYSYQLTQTDGMTLYFTAEVSNRMHGGFSSGSIADTKCTLEIDSAVIEI